jgi:hypothetical protein
MSLLAYKVCISNIWPTLSVYNHGMLVLTCLVVPHCAQVLYPESMHLTRGNHETKNMNKIYGFEGEVGAAGRVLRGGHHKSTFSLY